MLYLPRREGRKSTWKPQAETETKGKILIKEQNLKGAVS
jgi:hypothetical protein